MAAAAPFADGTRIETWTSRLAGLAFASPRGRLGSGGAFLVRAEGVTLLGDAAEASGSPEARSAFGRALLTDLLRNPEGRSIRLDRLPHGGFALALVDEEHGRLMLLRDAAGERALYWLRHAGRIWFATEPIQLLAVPGVERGLDLGRLVAHLLARNAQPERSFFAAIRRLPEGRALIADVAGERLLPLEPRPALQCGRAAAPALLASTLSAAVRRRLAPSGETGVLLSGGLDSGTVALEAARALAEHGGTLQVFTWRSRAGADIDERRVSSALLEACPNIVEHVIEADEYWPLRPGVPRLADECDPESNTLPELLAATVARARERGVEALLNGAGGDAVIGWSMPDLALLVRGRWLALARRWRRAGPVGALRGLLSPLRRRALPPWLGAEGHRWARSCGLGRPVASPRDLLSAAAFRRWLIEHSAVAATQERFDRWSRRAGVRLCAPWLDAELLALATRLPDAALEVEGPGKTLVRRAWQDRLPGTLLANPTDKEAGLELLRRGLLERGRAEVEALLGASELSRMELISTREALQHYWDRAAQRDIMPGLWSILTAEIWVRARLGQGLASSGAASSREQQ